MRKKHFTYEYFFTLTLIIFFSFFLIELLFRIFSPFTLLSFEFVRIIFFNLAMSMMFAFITMFFRFRNGRKALAFVLFILTTYVFFQQTFYDYLSRYITLQDSTYGVDKVIAFAVDFILSINLIHLIYYVPFLLMITVMKKLDHQPITFKFWPVLLTFLMVLVMHGASIGLLFINVDDEQLNKPYDVYQKVEHSSEAINQIGIFRYLFRDVINFINPSQQITIIAKPNEDPIIDDPDKEATITIDDTNWQELIANETDDEMLIIDEYLINQDIDLINEMTGIFKDKNLVFVMVEAFDYMAIDKELTPTLYKMATEGWFFDNFYSPQFSCATGQSEFTGLLGLIPEPGKCTINNFADNDYFASMFNIFNNEGYYSSSYHNWTDQYYDRLTLHANMYSDHFYNYDELPFKTIQGWQSDKELFELALPYFVDQEKFFSFVITSSTHFPYDVDSTLGNRYLDKIELVHPDYPMVIKRYLSKAMELDLGFAYLFDELAAKGKLDDTVFVLYSDHHPLKTDTDLFDLYSYNDQDRSSEYRLSNTPFIIYNTMITASIKHLPISPIDILPTLANLFDLQHDPRLYLGQDYFDENAKIVYFSNGSWLSEDGYYDASLGQFEPITQGIEIDIDELNILNDKVKNTFNIARLIYRNDYYKHRHDIVFPTIIEALN